jgi:hypothetical protein
MNDRQTILDAVTGGQPVQIEVKIDLESIAILAGAMVVAVLIGNVLAAAIVK